MLSLRTVARYQEAQVRLAAFLNVGDLIFYGKYKNKKGKIVRFLENEKGQPQVEIEPIPKGRKKNKVMGLFKIWSGKAIEEAQAKKELEEKGEVSEPNPPPKTARNEMDLVAQRVFTAWMVKARGIPMGETAEVGSIRIHRYRDHFKVTDLTNAGKRGKKVKVFTAGPSYSYKGNHDEWMERLSKEISSYRTYDRAWAFFNGLLKDAPREINLNEYVERGVDVLPGGTRKFNFKTPKDVEVMADPKDFTVINRWPLTDKDGKPTGQFHDTSYFPVNKKDALPFYAWLSANESKAKRMGIDEFRKLWREIGVRYDYH